MKKLLALSSLVAVFTLTGCATTTISDSDPLVFKDTITDLEGSKEGHDQAIINYFETKNLDGRPMRLKAYPENNKVYAYATKHSLMFDEFECLSDLSFTTISSDTEVSVEAEIHKTPSQGYAACSAIPTKSHYRGIKMEILNIYHGLERALK